nr:excinuclease ABC subunit UvrC [uncultured Oscillibacter sp.]
MTREELREKANDLPLTPGVYLMMDKTGKVIYVGKAKKLKNRVSQYFQDSAAHTVKTRQMVSQVDRFDTIFVSSEFEALVLENSLIKRHSPKYNILLKDDKGYPFVRLSRETYPRFSLVNKMAADSARYFGPFGGRQETRQALDAVCAALRLPTCRRQFPRDIGAERPCLNFHMGRCDGFCRPEMTAEEYNRRIEQAVLLLEGKSKQLLREMTAEMEAEAEALKFEQAALLRDRINAISALGKKQTVIAGLCADTDIWGLYRGSGKCCYAVLHVEKGQLTGRETELFTAPVEEPEEEMLSALTAQYYLPRSILPHEILLPLDTEDCEELSEVLTRRAGHKVWVHVPQRGEKAELLAMARRNAAQEA